MTLQQWIDNVDMLLQLTHNVQLINLTEQPLQQWHQAGMSPEDAVETIANNEDLFYQNEDYQEARWD